MGKQVGVILSSFRPERPAINRPGRKAGIGIAERWSAEGAALLIFQVPRLWRSNFYPASNPGLTAGPQTIFQDTPNPCRTPAMIFRLRHYF